MEKIVLAGGCFWCLQGPLETLKGVQKTLAGYIGGKTQNPTYEEVCTGHTGHIEGVEVVFDPLEVTLEKVLETFWRQIDPTDAHGQFADQGSQYVTAIFITSEEQRVIAQKSLENIQQHFEKPVVTKIVMAETFYPAEEHHQYYSEKNPLQYKNYRKFSGREGFLKKKWE